jgi:hypothetical protein
MIPLYFAAGCPNRAGNEPNPPANDGGSKAQLERSRGVQRPVQRRLWSGLSSRHRSPFILPASKRARLLDSYSGIAIPGIAGPVGGSKVGKPVTGMFIIAEIPPIASIV